LSALDLDKSDLVSAIVRRPLTVFAFVMILAMSDDSCDVVGSEVEPVSFSSASD
jgi:hypothetical protein